MSDMIVPSFDDMRFSHKAWSQCGIPCSFSWFFYSLRGGYLGGLPFLMNLRVVWVGGSEDGVGGPGTIPLSKSDCDIVVHLRKSLHPFGTPNSKP